MARTKASVGSKVSVAKSSKARCSVAPTPSSSGTSGSSEKASKGHSGGNPVCPRETPKWQKPITNFFINKEPSRGDDVDVGDEEIATSSKAKSKSNVIQSDDEEEILQETPKNKALDESMDLAPLNGEDSHKIEEYYPKGEKGKGVGKKTKGKENREESNGKRAREDEEIENVSKRVKVI